jgi:hypothetical protein
MMDAQLLLRTFLLKRDNLPLRQASYGEFCDNNDQLDH